MSETIDKNSFEPAYLQIAKLIKRQIASGIYLPGNKLPPESELKKTFKVSPMTIRRAINILLDQGIVNTIQGSGTFVRPIDFDTVAFRLEEFTKLFRDTEQTKVRLLEVKIERADKLVAENLQIKENDRTILLRRAIETNAEPVLYHEENLIYDPKQPIVEGEMEVTSLHGLFHKTGESTLKWGELAIEATILTEAIAVQLNTSPDTPAFKLVHVFYDFNDRRISWGRFICRGDRFRFTTKIGFSGSEQN